VKLSLSADDLDWEVAKAPTGAKSSSRLVTVAVPVWVKNDPDKPDDPVARRVRQRQPELVHAGTGELAAEYR
jgi:hypothetical protein